MSLVPPARIVIIGAGPIGLEAALYARYLGYEVEILEAGEVCENVLQWGHVRMFSPFSMNCSTLGLAALKAQDPDYQPPAPNALLTGREWYERYLLPLAQSDLLVDQIRTQTEVTGISRNRYLKHDLPGDARRGEDTFRIDCLDYRAIQERGPADATSSLRSISAKAVLDCSGTFGNSNSWLAGGELSEAAIGESLLRFTIPNLTGSEREDYAGQHTLVLGSGYSAATSVVTLADLADEHAHTHVTWLTRAPAASTGPINRLEHDRLPERDALAERANELALHDDSVVDWIASSRIVGITETEEGRLLVRYRQLMAIDIQLESDEELDDDNIDEACEEHEVTVDRIVVNVGFRPNTEIFRELQVHLCYATEGPMKLAAALLAQGGPHADCLDQPSCGPAALMTTEPNFFVLGAKSYGRNSNFLFAHGVQQIRDAFTIIGGRETLDLYESVKNLV